jgi:hypothetical protein
MFGITNIQTTLAGLPAFVTAVYAVYHSIRTGEAPSKENLEIIAAAISVVWLAIVAKDKNVTGGTVPQTKEAEVRVDAPEVITMATVPLPPRRI